MEKIKLLVSKEIEKEIEKYNNEDIYISKNGSFHTDNLEFLDIEHVEFISDKDEFELYEDEKYEINYYHIADVENLNNTYFANQSINAEDVYGKNEKVLFLSCQSIRDI